jgi:PucR C-terminal helix-turn-helix domain
MPPSEQIPSKPPIVRASQVAVIMRSELPDLAREIITEIRDKIPEYARPMDGPYGHWLSVGVREALTSFLDSVADPAASQEQRDQVCRMLGQHEAKEGRSLDSLQAAYRIGLRVGWRRLMQVGLRYAVPSSVMAELVDSMLSYHEEIVSLSVQGYLEIKALSAQSQHEWRRRLLGLVLERPAAPARAIAELAELVGWTVPDEVTLVALEPGRPGVPELGGDSLAELSGPEPHLLLPGRISVSGRAALARSLAGRRCAIGPSVPLHGAGDSLRWARRALTLAKSGVFGAAEITFCEDYLVELLLLADDRLVDQVAQRRLGALGALSPVQRQRVEETFGAWLETKGTAPEMAERLKVHPQTVRYRMRVLERTLGGKLTDPDTRFAIELVLRATRLRNRAAG